ncbi:MAG: hydrogenase nickel incorporation protein HypB [Thermoanaerobaculia bacterium]|nr:hydrogenase nickel incorporation protein HypB [Thermoanaerobaculia bacterium]
MCDTCGCGDTEIVSIDVQEKILAKNDQTARHNREHFDRHGVFCVNIMGSPGAGKTALLEATARAAGGGTKIAAIAGDLATENDAKRLEDAGIRSVTINTGTACHLDASMVHHVLHEMELDGIDYLFIENVGNLVCPAIYDLGQHLNVIALAVTEGEDKPLKYPVMFKGADLVLMTKSDLLPHLPGIELSRIEDSLRHVMPEPRSFSIASTDNDGIAEWLTWLELARNRTAEREETLATT